MVQSFDGERFRGKIQDGPLTIHSTFGTLSLPVDHLLGMVAVRLAIALVVGAFEWKT